jgi:hypothetical protein
VPSTLEQVLDLWREAERDLESHPPGCPERPQIGGDVERLRWLYQSITHDVRDHLFRLEAADRTIVLALSLRMQSRAEATGGSRPCDHRPLAVREPRAIMILLPDITGRAFDSERDDAASGTTGGAPDSSPMAAESVLAQA